MLTAERIQSVRTELNFSRPQDAIPDAERPGVLRGPDWDVERPVDRRFDVHAVKAWDWAALEGFEPDLIEHGFATADLSRLSGLQVLLDRIRTSGRLGASEIDEIRRALTGRSLPLSGGRRMKLLFVSREGFLMRRAEPAGRPDDTEPLDPNGLDAAVNVHADQDVRGTPLREMLRGAAPWLLHHESPDGRNTWSPFFLLNVWIPLQQITRPLCLMDRRSLDRRRHQLRFGLKVDRLLERGAEQAVNHVWSFLHDDAQRWFFASELDAGTAYVFETLATPHGSFVLPGEELAAARSSQLEEALAAVDTRDEAALARASSRERPRPGADVTTPLRRAIARMDELLDEAGRRSAALCGGQDAGWREGVRRAQQRVVRRSVEMRALGIVTRDAWPFSRW